MHNFTYTCLHKHVHHTETHITWWYVHIRDRICMNGKPHAHECERKHMQTYTCTCMQTRILTNRHTHICSHMQMHASRKDVNTLTHTCSSALRFSLNFCERSLHSLSMVLYNQGINTGSSHNRLKTGRADPS